MSPTANSGVTVACLCLLSAMRTGLGEHASPTASLKSQRRSSNIGAKSSQKGFLTSSSQLREELREAVDEALGVGHGMDQQNLEVIRHQIAPMWQAMHKNAASRVDRRSFRYVVQDFFLQKHHLSLVGLEANLAADTQSEAALLTAYAPNYVKKVLEGDSSLNGFLIEDAVVMIAALRRLVENTGAHMLEGAYKASGVEIKMHVGREPMHKILEAYMLRWMMGDDPESIAMLEANESLKAEAFDDWQHIVEFVHGHLSQFEFAQQHSKSRSSVNAWNGFRPRFSFVDAQVIVGTMALSFGSWWESECATVKDSLMKMDHKNTGHVKLSDFHGSALNGEWRFSESKEYLREMGALDETSSWRGPRVIITNYLQAPSNCIITTEHYRVCCANECQDYLDDLEESLGGAAALPEEILPIIERLDSGLEDAEPRLTSALRSELQKIASANAGKVPIHGRLFAQWMHYVFPLECPFPHKSGTTTTLTPLAFGDAYMASETEMANHTSEPATNSTSSESADLEHDWKAQWSDEEELLTELPTSSWEADLVVFAFALLLLASLGGIFVKIGIASTGDGVGKSKDFLMGHSHHV